jgi:hypothetical protein
VTLTRAKQRTDPEAIETPTSISFAPCFSLSQADNASEQSLYQVCRDNIDLQPGDSRILTQEQSSVIAANVAAIRYALRSLIAELA